MLCFAYDKVLMYRICTLMSAYYVDLIPHFLVKCGKTVAFEYKTGHVKKNCCTCHTAVLILVFYIFV